MINCPGCGVGFERAWPAQRYCSIPCALWARVEIGSFNECWPWPGSRKKRAYGGITFGGKRYDVHRVAYESVNGSLDGLLALHKCDNPICCNPSHLFAGSHRDNSKDCWNKGRGVSGFALKGPIKGSAHYRAKITEADAAYIRTTKETAPTLAARYGVTDWCINNIRARKSWKHVSAPHVSA